MDFTNWAIIEIIFMIGVLTGMMITSFLCGSKVNCLINLLNTAMEMSKKMKDQDDWWKKGEKPPFLIDDDDGDDDDEGVYS